MWKSPFFPTLSFRGTLPFFPKFFPSDESAFSFYPFRPSTFPLIEFMIPKRNPFLPFFAATIPNFRKRALPGGLGLFFFFFPPRWRALSRDAFFFKVMKRSFSLSTPPPLFRALQEPLPCFGDTFFFETNPLSTGALPSFLLLGRELLFPPPKQKGVQKKLFSCIVLCHFRSRRKFFCDIRPPREVYSSPPSQPPIQSSRFTPQYQRPPFPPPPNLLNETSSPVA